jgi:hypothetical protein
MPTVPRVEVDMERSEDRKDGGGRVDPFLLGLGGSKRLEEKAVVADVFIGEHNDVEKGWGDDSGWTTASSSLSAPLIPSPATTTIAAASKMANITSPKKASAERVGMPIAVPVPPTPKPATKSPSKVVPPKAVGFAKNPDVKTSFTPVVGGLIDPFLAALQHPNKSDTPPRPKTPSVSTDSAESTPKRPSPARAQNLSVDVSPMRQSSPPSPTASLSSSWTLVEKTRKETLLDRDVSPSAPPPTPTQSPVRRTWFGSKTSASVTPVATPLSTPLVPATNPQIQVIAPIDSGETPAIVSPTPKPSAGRKLFTFELKVGQSIVSTPVHEMDDPRVIAEQFAKEHDLETRLPGGKATVEKIVYYFESQYVERRREREKRRAERRERMKSSLTEEAKM